MKKVKKAIVPVAGFGTRFLPFTKSVPKEMLPIVDTPTIQIIVKELVDSGIEDILFITTRNKNSIEDHFDYSIELEDALKKSNKHKEYEYLRSIPNMANFYYKRQKEMKGLGHAILQGKSFVGEDNFVVILGDDIIHNPIKPATLQLLEKFYELKKSIIGCKRVPIEDISKYGSMESEKISSDTYRIIRCVEKPKPEEALSDLALIGRYVFTKDIFKYIELTKPGVGGEIQITDAIDLCSKNEGAYGFLYEGMRYDVGNKLGYLMATVEYALRDKNLGEDFKKYLKTLKL